jgi:hypothetical protein
MIACPILRTLVLGVALPVLGGTLIPLVSTGQTGYPNDQPGYARTASYAYNDSGNARNVTGNARNDPGNTVTSNVPLNEINIHAFRHFHRLFRSAAAGERWYKSPEGYQVSFLLDAQPHQAFFDRRGAYLYSLRYYGEKEIPRAAGDLIKMRYPDYRIGVVTEITDGEKTFFLVRIANPSFVKTLSVCDGRIDMIEEMVNGGVTSGGF